MRTKMLGILVLSFTGAALAVDGTNLPGHDYANFDAPSAFVCRTSCGGESRATRPSMARGFRRRLARWQDSRR